MVFERIRLRRRPRSNMRPRLGGNHRRAGFWPSCVGNLPRRGRAERFDLLKIFLTLDGDEVSYAEAGRRLDMSESAVKSALHRMRRRYAELVRQEIADTVGSPEDIDDEIRYLFAVLCDESP